MYRIIQKLSASVAPLLLLAVVVPALMSGTAAAAIAKAAAGGSCLLERVTVTQVSQTTTPNTVGKCSKLMPSGKDSLGKKFSTTGCSGVTETNGKYTIVETPKCTDPRMTGTATAKPAPPATCTNADQSTCPGGSAAVTITGGDCHDISKCDLIKNYINPAVNFLSALVGVAVVISIIIGGIQYGSSAGDSQKVTAAKNRIRNSIIALITFIFLYSMLNFLIPGGLL